MDEGQFGLLNVDEVDKLFYSSSANDKRKILLFCSDELKLKEVTNFGTNDREIFDFIMSFKDGNKGKLAYYNYLKHNNIDINSLLIGALLHDFYFRDWQSYKEKRPFFRRFILNIIDLFRNNFILFIQRKLLANLRHGFVYLFARTLKITGSQRNAVGNLLHFGFS